MTKLLIRLFVGREANTENICVRTRYGNLAGMVGIVCNVLLFIGKFLVGTIFGSMAIAADAFNNLSDAGSSIVSLLGFKLGAKEPDEKHPYGHARYEYLAGLAVCVMILAIGLNLLKEGINKIIHPQLMEFSWLTIGVLTASIVVKMWLLSFNLKVAEIIKSDTLKATAADSRNDCISTGAVLLATIITAYTHIAVLDGIMAVVVALFVMYSGYGLLRDAIDPLLGMCPDEELVRMISDKVMSYDEVLGFHDLMVHDYGPGRQFASIHIELPAEMDTLIAHDIIDNIERDFLMVDNIQVVVHYDPIVTSDERVGELKSYLSQKIKEYDTRLSMHDLRIVPGPTHTNVIFDLVLPADYKEDKEKLIAYVRDAVSMLNQEYMCVIKLEQSYSVVMK